MVIVTVIVDVSVIIKYFIKILVSNIMYLSTNSNINGNSYCNGNYGIILKVIINILEYNVYIHIIML